MSWMENETELKILEQGKKYELIVKFVQNFMKGFVSLYEKHKKKRKQKKENIEKIEQTCDLDSGNFSFGKNLESQRNETSQ